VGDPGQGPGLLYLRVWTPPWLAQQPNPAMSPHTKGNKQAPGTLKNISGERTPRSMDVLVKSCTKFDVCEENNSSSSLQLPFIPYRIAFHIGMKNCPLYMVGMALSKK